SATEYERKLELRTREGDAYRAADAAVRDHADEILARTPKIVRKVSGYNLAALVGARSLVPLVVGSEGTLAVVAEAELALVPRPRATRGGRCAVPPCGACTACPATRSR